MNKRIDQNEYHHDSQQDLVSIGPSKSFFETHLHFNSVVARLCRSESYHSQTVDPTLSNTLQSDFSITIDKPFASCEILVC